MGGHRAHGGRSTNSRIAGPANQAEPAVNWRQMPRAQALLTTVGQLYTRWIGLAAGSLLLPGAECRPQRLPRPPVRPGSPFFDFRRGGLDAASLILPIQNKTWSHRIATNH
jgi:hypothetical protein